MKSLFLIFFVAIFSFSSCTKYDNNPVLVFGSVKNHLDGKWSIVNEYINDQPVSPVVSFPPWWSTDPEILYFSFDVLSKNEKQNLIQHGEPESLINKTGKYKIEMNDSTGLGGAFLIDNNKSELSFYSELLPPDTIPFISNLPGYLFMFDQWEDGYYLKDKWQISKLTNKELWLHTSFNGNEYEIHFKKI